MTQQFPGIAARYVQLASGQWAADCWSGWFVSSETFQPGEHGDGRFRDLTFMPATQGQLDEINQLTYEPPFTPEQEAWEWEFRHQDTWDYE